MLRFSLLLGLLWGLSGPVEAGSKPPLVFLRIHVQTAGEGLPSSQAVQVTLPATGEIIQIRALPEVTERDLVAVVPQTSGAVLLKFNHIGEVALNAATAQNQERLLVVMIDGYVVYAPVIDVQISNGELTLPHPSLRPEILQLLEQKAQENVREASRT